MPRYQGKYLTENPYYISFKRILFYFIFYYFISGSCGAVDRSDASFLLLCLVSNSECSLEQTDYFCFRAYHPCTHATYPTSINPYAPCILYIGQTYRTPPEYAFYIFSQQIYLINFF